MYNIQFTKDAEDFFKKLDKFNQEIIGKKIEHLKENPILGKPLVSKLAGYWSLRVGKFRVIYLIKNKELIVLVMKIGHRKSVYS